MLFDLGSAELAAVIEADKLGQLRTGAASGVAAKFLAKSDASTLGDHRLWLAGRVAGRLHPRSGPGDRARGCLLPLGGAARRVLRAGGAEAGESHRDAGEQDVVVTVTTSKDPVLRGEWLQPGALVCAVGANDPNARELDNAVLERATFVCCDSREQARLESGDLIEPVAQGLLDWLEVYELQDIVAGEVSARESDEDIVVFKSNGIAAWDAAIGAAVVERAREVGAGRDL